jgi:hypothetical protein
MEFMFNTLRSQVEHRYLQEMEETEKIQDTTKKQRKIEQIQKAYEQSVRAIITGRDADLRRYGKEGGNMRIVRNSAIGYVPAVYPVAWQEVSVSEVEESENPEVGNGPPPERPLTPPEIARKTKKEQEQYWEDILKNEQAGKTKGTLRYYNEMTYGGQEVGWRSDPSTTGPSGTHSLLKNPEEQISGSE